MALIHITFEVYSALLFLYDFWHNAGKKTRLKRLQDFTQIESFFQKKYFKYFKCPIYSGMSRISPSDPGHVMMPLKVEMGRNAAQWSA
jgi:hypothetical protein